MSGEIVDNKVNANPVLIPIPRDIQIKRMKDIHKELIKNGWDREAIPEEMMLFAGGKESSPNRKIMDALMKWKGKKINFQEHL